MHRLSEPENHPHGHPASSGSVVAQPLGAQALDWHANAPTKHMLTFAGMCPCISGATRGTRLRKVVKLTARVFYRGGLARQGTSLPESNADRSKIYGADPVTLSQDKETDHDHDRDREVQRLAGRLRREHRPHRPAAPSPTTTRVPSSSGVPPKACTALPQALSVTAITGKILGKSEGIELEPGDFRSGQVPIVFVGTTISQGDQS